MFRYMRVLSSVSFTAVRSSPPKTVTYLLFTLYSIFSSSLAFKSRRWCCIWRSLNTVGFVLLIFLRRFFEDLLCNDRVEVKTVKIAITLKYRLFSYDTVIVYTYVIRLCCIRISLHFFKIALEYSEQIFHIYMNRRKYSFIVLVSVLLRIYI